MAIDEILQRLDRVRKNGNGKWSSLCPAHDDKSPSLAIAESSDGKILLHCFSGCPFSEIAVSIGLDQKDFFPPSNWTYRLNPGYSPNQISDALGVLKIAHFDRQKKRTHSGDDVLAIKKAASIVGKARRLGCL